MRYPFNRFYSDTFVFAAFSFIVVVLGVLVSYFDFRNYTLYSRVRDLESGVASVIIVVMTIMLFVAHVRGDRNALHAIMGAFLCLVIIKTVPFAIKYYTIGAKTFFQSFFMSYVTFLVASTVYFFINHFIINNRPFSSPYLVFSNQLICGLLFVGVVVFYIQYLTAGQDITDMFSITVYVGMCNLVSCVETTVDNSRELRERGLGRK